MGLTETEVSGWRGRLRWKMRVCEVGEDGEGGERFSDGGDGRVRVLWCV